MVNLTNNFYNVGLSYKKADVAARGRFSVSKENQTLLLEEAKEKGINGIFVLSTCNRTELFGFAKHPFQLIELLCNYSKGTVEEFVKVSHVFKNKEAYKHLFRIGTGLDSQILGDYEIVGQLKLAFYNAKKVGTINMYLERLFNLVLHASKEIKNNTSLSSGTTTVSYAAVQYLKENVTHLESKKILLYGLGEIGKNTAKNIKEYLANNKITIINRTFSKAEEYAKENDLIVKKHEFLIDEIDNSDILIVATSGHLPTINNNHIAKNKELLILDLSIPRNVDTSIKDLSNITIVDVDMLSKTTDATLEERKKQIPLAEEIIMKYKKEFLEWLNVRSLTPAINSLKASLENIQDDGINYFRKKIKNFDEDQAKIVTTHLIQKITTQYAKHLKNESTQINQSIQVVNSVFHIES